MFVFKINGQNKQRWFSWSKMEFVNIFYGVYITIFLFNNDLARRDMLEFGRIGCLSRRVQFEMNTVWKVFFCNKTGDWNYNSSGVDPVGPNLSTTHWMSCHCRGWDIQNSHSKTLRLIPKFKKKTYKCRTSQPSTEVKPSPSKNTWATFEQKTSNKRNTKL